MANNLSLILALAGGILPALVWLLFWLREDSAHPEPRALIAVIFLGGAIAVVPAYLAEELLRIVFHLSPITDPGTTVLWWAAVEEIIKFLVIAPIAFHARSWDEPLDAMIYLITAALGFSAAENSLFMLNVLQSGGTHLHFWLNGNFRFIGATVVHVVSSAVLGGAMALAFCEHRYRLILATVAGLIGATGLHALFNYFIIKTAETEVLKIFILFWALAIVTIYLFEKVKTIVCHVYVK